MYPERAADPHCGQFTVVHQATRHLADPHEAGHFGDGEKLSTRRLVGNRAPGACFPLAESRPDGPFIDVIATQSFGTGCSSGFPTAGYDPALTRGE